MSGKSTILEDSIGTVILVIAALVLAALAGFCTIFTCELLASAVSWVRLPPVAGWGILGTVAGASIGIVHGMKVRGRSDDIRKVYVAIAVVLALLLVLGVFSPAGLALITR